MLCKTPNNNISYNPFGTQLTEQRFGIKNAINIHELQTGGMLITLKTSVK